MADDSTTPEPPRTIGQLILAMTQAADALTDRAGQYELHAAKNAAAGYVEGEKNKLRRAGNLRRVAVLLASARLQALIRDEKTGLATILQTALDRGTLRARPRPIDPATVKPTRIDW